MAPVAHGLAAVHDLRPLLSCLPATVPGEYRLELGLRGPVDAVREGMAELIAGVETLGFHWQQVVTERPRRRGTTTE